MKATHIGNSFQIYDDSLEVYDELPVQCYIIRFSDMSGFYLEKYFNIASKEEKVYGDHNIKVERVMNSFNIIERSLGVILSGEKGIGKSLFAKMLAEESVKKGMPVIVVSSYNPGIASYIEQIDQPVMVLFDEFDKTFDDDSQLSMLSLFDGISQGKKLFVITCNEIRGLNEFLINRPGRFHYHIRFNAPNAIQITEYLKDKLLPEYYGEIDNVVLFAMKARLNYDTLRAIAFELNQGISFKDTIQDLNILNYSSSFYKVEATFNTGEKMFCGDCCMDLFDKGRRISCWIQSYDGRDQAKISFLPETVDYDVSTNIFSVPVSVINIQTGRDGSKENGVKTPYLVSVVLIPTPTPLRSYDYES